MTPVTVAIDEDKQLRVTFPYDRSFIDRLKTVALGLTWNKTAKAWMADGLEPLLDFERAGIPYKPANEYTKQAILDWFATLDKIVKVKTADVSGELYGFQRSGTRLLELMERGILGDDMGLGKSKQSIEAAKATGAKNVLVVCPKSLTHNWLHEFSLWWPEIDAAIVPDSPKERQAFWANSCSERAIITNYEKLRASGWPFERYWDALILDEASIVKNVRTQVHKKVARVAERSKNVWPLTGTPMEKDIQELYGVMAVVRPATFGSWFRFSRQHVNFDFWDNPESPKNMPLLRERVGLFFVRRRKQDVLKDLPPKLPPVIHTFGLSAYEYGRYREIKRGIYTPPDWDWEEAPEGPELMEPVTRLLRAQQLTSSVSLLYPQDDERGSKFKELTDIIDRWDEENIIIFTRFSDMADRLRDWLDLPERATITGAVHDSEERLARVNDFNAGRLGKVFVGTDAMAFGLNITSANLVIHYDRLWNPAKEWQREDRAHRIGQRSPVHVIYLLAENTIDIGIHHVVERRAQVFRDVIDGTEEQFKARFDEPKFTKQELAKLLEGERVREALA